MAFQINLLCYFPPPPPFFSNLFDKDELGMPLIEAVKDFVIYIKQKFQGQVAGILCAGGGIRGCDIAMHEIVSVCIPCQTTRPHRYTYGLSNNY